MLDSGTPPPRGGLPRFHTGDAFFREAGEQEHARHRLGLTGEQIADRILSQLRGFPA
jgi:hypothetical protein